MTTVQPTIVERESQPYVAVRGVVTLSTFSAIADRIPEVFAWVAARGIAPAGSPFFRYLVVDMPGRLEVEAGVPTTTAVAGEGDVVAGMLPAGRFATTTHVGHYGGLVDTTADLLAWAAERDLKWDVADTPLGERWAVGSRCCRPARGSCPIPPTGSPTSCSAWPTEHEVENSAAPRGSQG